MEVQAVVLVISHLDNSERSDLCHMVARLLKPRQGRVLSKEKGNVCYSTEMRSLKRM